jgi:hypothetical protein
VLGEFGHVEHLLQRLSRARFYRQIKNKKERDMCLTVNKETKKKNHKQMEMEEEEPPPAKKVQTMSQFGF